MRIGYRLGILAFVPVFVFSVSGIEAVRVPKPLKTRFIIGDPVWQELPVREKLRGDYKKCWQLAINTLLENNFDIATMDKDSGYIRTIWNEGVIVLGSRWLYKVQVSIKMVFSDEKPPNSAEPILEKVRLQVTGDLSKVYRGRTTEFHRGYDQIIMKNLFQDLQSKFGSI